MKKLVIVRSPSDWAATFGPRATLSVGNFDGLHLGHQKILRSVAERASASNTLPCVVTFDPHPLKVLRPAQAPLLLQTLDQRLAGFEALGIEAVLVLNFDASLAALSPEAFARGILSEQLRAAAILVGQNFRFGYKQGGDVTVLREIGERAGFAVEIIPPFIIAGEVVSSSAIRRAISEGRVDHAAVFLGRPYALTGKIERGAGRGSTILVPTLNLAPDQEMMPKTGVYATETSVAGKTYRSATNVGFRPTFEGKNLSIESHLFDFSQKIVEGPLEVRFWHRLRDEQKFSGPEELRRQIALDLEQSREFFRRLDLARDADQDVSHPALNK